MPFGEAVRRKAVAAAREWRKLRFNTLRRQLLTPYNGEIRLPLFSSTGSSRESAVSIKLATNNEELMQWCQLEYFGFLNSKEPPTFAPSPSLGSTEICVHVGPPKSLGYPYTLTCEAENFAEGVERSESYAAWEETEPVGPRPARWLTQPLLDGFVARRVKAHVGLSSGHMPVTMGMARQLDVALFPHEVSPYYIADELLSSWGIFGSDTDGSGADPTSHDNIHSVVELAHASAVLPMHRGAWLYGAAICNKDGDAVLILGPRGSGKTTLALHCLGASQNTRLIGVENFHIAHMSTFANSTSHSKGSETLLMGMPTSAKVGMGALLGTLRPNSRLAQAAHDFHYSQDFIKQLIRNSELNIWRMGFRFPVHIGEAFGPQRWNPTFLGRLRGIVVLNWNIQELSLSNAEIKTQVKEWKTERDITNVLGKLADGQYGSLFKGHYLIRSVYNEANAWQYFREALFNCEKSERPFVYELQGSVNFDLAVRFVCEIIMKEITDQDK